MLTTSSAEEDILRSYKLHANAYVTKPVDLDQFMSAVRQIDEFFVQVVRLPECDGTHQDSAFRRDNQVISLPSRISSSRNTMSKKAAS